jgi:phenylpropionate dioxygenase-like ring-hydroxylating dioxygenase large terminal subunit
MTFAGFADVWTPAMLLRKLGGRPLRVVVAGVPLVVFRDGRGKSGALVDRCPHRGAALSLGRVAPDGTLECPYHGWRFDVEGANRAVPLNPQARCETLGAAAVPVREIGDLLWVYTRPGAAAPPEPLVPESLTDPGLSRTYIERDWACHWTRAMENMLDFPHLPFVHRRTIGRTYRAMTPRSRLDIQWEDTAFGGRARASLDGDAGGAWVEFYRPNMTVLHIPIPGRRLRIHSLATPAAPGRTRMMVAVSRDFARWPVLEPLFRWRNGRVIDEDQAVVESGGPGEIPPPGREHSVATDLTTLQFRRYYYAVLRASSADRPAAGAAD